MSAFTLDTDHIDLLVTVAMKVAGFDAKYVNIPETADLLGQELLRENYRSVNHRYSEDEKPPEYHWTPVAELQAEKLTPGQLLQVINAVHCYEYQTCEHPQWVDSQSFWTMKAIENWAAVELTKMRWRKAPAYAGDTDLTWVGLKHAKWEWHRVDGFPVVERVP